MIPELVFRQIQTHEQTIEELREALAKAEDEIQELHEEIATNEAISASEIADIEAELAVAEMDADATVADIADWLLADGYPELADAVRARIDEEL